jgi:hypothetical protein
MSKGGDWLKKIEKQIIGNMKEMFPKLTELEKAKLLYLTEGMAFMKKKEGGNNGESAKSQG